ncbi:hypothetical protein BDA99DRAFT_560179 [Phascolomyces articulosus]|uniref:Uncharacterized protein n=1 Tax=Phascolomyces articulosus TaxID=60185 RepID=A0AAD5K9D8_9FUNG|nr:hypothetical protein BDA99DRAFT_560179 [Phascolomyces articulosus]
MTTTPKEFFTPIQIFMATHESNQSHPTGFRIIDGAAEARNYDTDPTLHTKGTVRGLVESELKTRDITSTNGDIENELESECDYIDDGYKDEGDGSNFDL